MLKNFKKFLYRFFSLKNELLKNVQWPKLLYAYKFLPLQRRDNTCFLILLFLLQFLATRCH